MGSCWSSDTSSVNPLTAKVISINGNLCEYSVPVTVSQVLLEMEMALSCFLCNSDGLYYDEYMQALDSDEELQVGQIYFLLPTSRLQYRLTASDMAALAVKASSALVGSFKKSSRGRRKIQVSPIILEVKEKQRQRHGLMNDVLKGFEKTSAMGGVTVTRSGSVKKLQRNASRRAKTAYRSFRVRLSTIYEGSVLLE